MQRMIYTYLLLVLIPSIVILGHAVIPHYYDHNLWIHENNKADEHNDAESCLLSQVYVKLNKDEQLFKTVCFNFNFKVLFSKYN